MAGPIVKVKQGIVRGTIKENIDGGNYYSFRGLPYAQPPVGELRFEEPQPSKPWKGVLEASQESKQSMQYNFVTRIPEGSEDCLYLNIGTKVLRGKQAVMVYIHGGGFFTGSNSFEMKSPDYLLKEDIVYVSLNYRLGVLGFLNMDGASNLGLKDLILGLSWVKENIHVFGGDVDNITIFGESAGAACVHALCLSPLAKGLFHKAIMQSGNLLDPWTYRPTNQDVGFALAKTLGKDCTDPAEVISLLKTVPARSLVEAYDDTYPESLFNIRFRLVTTNDSKSLKPVFPRPIKELSRIDNNISMIIGHTSHEGILRFFGDTTNFFSELNLDFEKVIADYLKIDKSQVLDFAKSIREFYFGTDEINNYKVNEVVQFIGDLLFVANLYELADIQAQKSAPTYLYKFSYRHDYLGIKDILGVKIEGTCHAEELGCLFYSEEKRGKLIEGTRDYKAMKRLTTMWTNFAKTGDPTPVTNDLIPTKWKPIEKTKRHFLEITDELTCVESPDGEMWKVWKPLMESLDF